MHIFSPCHGLLTPFTVSSLHSIRSSFISVENQAQMFICNSGKISWEWANYEPTLSPENFRWTVGCFRRCYKCVPFVFHNFWGETFQYYSIVIRIGISVSRWRSGWTGCDQLSCSLLWALLDLWEISVLRMNCWASLPRKVYLVGCYLANDPCRSHLMGRRGHGAKVERDLSSDAHDIGSGGNSHWFQRECA